MFLRDVVGVHEDPATDPLAEGNPRSHRGGALTARHGGDDSVLRLGVGLVPGVAKVRALPNEPDELA